MIPTTLGVALVVFIIYHAAPGDPAVVMMGAGSGGAMSSDNDVQARVESFRREFGLDRAYPVQFLNWIGPVNFMRDGHSWFGSPYKERRVTRENGGPAMGVPLPIDPPVPLERERELALATDADAVALGDAGALERLRGEDRGAVLAALMTALELRFRRPSGAAARETEALSTALSDLEGFVPGDLPLGEEDEAKRALIERWFGWYYTEKGATRVRNTGERPWGGLLAFDLGREMQTKNRISPELTDRLKVTVPLSLVSVLLSYLIAMPLGIFSARRQGTSRDTVVTVGLFVLYSIPTFWAGLMLVILFGKTGIDLLPVVGLHDKDASTFSSGRYAWDTVLHCILPVLTLTYGSLAYLSRQMRAGMLDVIRQDYIRTARAKGLSENVVVYKHALRNSMIPVITLLASILPVLIGGSIIVEKVFDIPGMGKYAFEGLINRDFNIVMATTVFVGIMTQIGILLSDITYSLVDPRIRHK